MASICSLLFLSSSLLIICDYIIFILVVAAVHESCSAEMDTPVQSNGSVTSFCGKNCREVAKFSFYFSSQSSYSMALILRTLFVIVDVVNKVVEELWRLFNFSLEFNHITSEYRLPRSCF